MDREAWLAKKRESNKRYYERNKGKVGERNRKYLKWRRYGLDTEQLQSLSDRAGGQCEICGKPVKKLHIDHNHATGQVRGMLCPGCNIRLCMLENEQWRKRAMNYLRRTDATFDRRRTKRD